MTSNEMLKADVLDIVFDNRNKLYGAYTLRKYYPRRLGASLSICLASTFLLLLLVGAGSGKSELSRAEGPGVVVRSFDIPKVREEKPKEKMQQKSAAKAVAQQEFREMKIVKETKQVVADQQTLAITNVGGFTLPGGPGEGPAVPKLPLGDPTDGEVKPAVKEEPPIQSEPEFPGGMQAWVRFLSRYLQNPNDLEAGEKRTVLIRFQVAVDGSVTGFDVIQSGGRDYDNEVIRVLKRMPKWKPAIQNGVAVTRSFTQPVSFVGLAE
jgi:protein TonB